jgi:AcrR family transcriptional regulator
VVQIDEVLRRATISVLREQGWEGLTLERVAEVAGRARSTLWRQGLTVDLLIEALTGELADDFQASMYPLLTSAGTGRERLERGLVALCELVDRHLPLLLATDEAFHQSPHPGQPPDYLRPFMTFLREGAADGTLAPGENIIEAADAVFNATAWPYAHFRGRHGWPAARARRVVVGLVLNGVTHEREETS